MTALSRPQPEEIAAYYHGYVAQCPEPDLLSALRGAERVVRDLHAGIPEARGDHRYVEGKWSIKEVLQHMIDCERVFAYRALSFARNDGTELPGFDENQWAPAAEAGRRSLAELKSEQESVKASTLLLFSSFTDEMLLRMGRANGNPFSVRSLGWAIAGHDRHHAAVIKQRYL